MSEEDYKSVGAIKNQWIETKDEYLDMALNVIDNLKIKNKQLKERIDKAIEYIEDKAFLDYERETSHDLYDGQIFKLIEILRGD